jgi:hypothetical protein
LHNRFQHKNNKNQYKFIIQNPGRYCKDNAGYLWRSEADHEDPFAKVNIRVGIATA